MSASSQPEIFGKYHLLEKIATGGMAEVYRARAYGMAGFEKILVIKKILDQLLQDEEFVNLFIDEARIAVQLLHVNIVQVFDLGEVDGQYYMAMEYVHGLDLSRVVTRARNIGPFPIPLALFITAEVLKALQFAHERVDESGRQMHIVHCDISPQNILISYAGEVKITDFGISRAAFQASEQHKVIRGKYAYMSPEQVEGKPLSGQTDLFSVGIVLYEILTGRRLFKMRTRDETLARVRRAEVPSPRAYRPEISEDLEGILLRALARQPAARFASAGEMPRTSLAALTQEWSAIIAESEGEAWERGSGSMLVVWVARGGLRDSITRAVEAAVALQRVTLAAGYRLSAGVAPGVARISSETRRPSRGWELAGPFYLARWMMNLSAHRGRVLLTEVGARQVRGRSGLLGRIPIQGSRYINLYELG